MISIVLPVYNSENTLKRCIDSILSQTYTQYELIIVNDGSADLSQTIINGYAEADDRVIAVSKENGGVSSARNVGLEKASGEYICFVDSDDYVAPAYLEELNNCINSHDTDLAICLISRSKDLESNNITCFEDKNLLIQSIVNNEEHNAGPYNKLFKRDLIGGLRFAEDIYLGEDTLFCVEYAKKCRNAVRINKVLYYYEIPTSSALYVNDKSKLRRNLTVIESRKRMLYDVCEIDEKTKNQICESLLGYISYIATLGVSYYDIMMTKIASQELRLLQKRFVLKCDGWLQMLGANYVLYYFVRMLYLKCDALKFHIGNFLKP